VVEVLLLSHCTLVEVLVEQEPYELKLHLSAVLPMVVTVVLELLHQ
jgi:hypothetical protein